MDGDYILKLILVSQDNDKCNLQRLVILISDQYYLQIDSVSMVTIILAI